MLGTSDRETAEWYAGALGKREIKRLEEGLSYGASVIRDGVSFNAREKSELIVLPEEILELRNLTGYIKMAEGFPAARFHLPYHPYDRLCQRKRKLVKEVFNCKYAMPQMYAIQS